MSRLISFTSGRFRCPGFSVAPRSRVRTIPGFRSGGRPPRTRAEEDLREAREGRHDENSGSKEGRRAERRRGTTQNAGHPGSTGQPAPANAPSSAAQNEKEGFRR